MRPVDRQRINRTKPAPPPAGSLPPDIRIRMGGMTTGSGSHPYTLFGAVAGGVSCIAADEAMTMPSADGGEDRVLVSRVSDVVAEDPGERLWQCLLPALAETWQAVSDAGIEPGRTRLWLLLPPAHSERGRDLDTRQWAEALADSLPELEAERITLVPLPAAGGASVLGQAAAALSDEQCDAVIFGGVDSLGDELSCREWARAGALKTEQRPDGAAPGEAAACMFLAQDQAPTTDALPSFRLVGLAHEIEPNAFDTDTRPMRALGTALGAAMDAAGVQASMIGAAIHCDDGRPAAALEWHQVRQRFWPLRLSEEQRVAMQLGEIEAPQPEAAGEPETMHLAPSLGWLGAAALPIGLALAYERFIYTTAPIDTCAVLDIPASIDWAISAEETMPSDSAREHASTWESMKNRVGRGAVVLRRDAK